MHKYIIILFLFVFNNFALAQKNLKIAMIPGEPFVIKNKNGYSGIAVDIWDQIAKENNLKYQFIMLDDNVDKALLELKKGYYDVVIGPISETYQRNSITALTNPYYINQIGLIEKKQKSKFQSLIKQFKNNVSPTIIFFIFVFIVYVHIYWYSERKSDSKIPYSYKAGVSYVIWAHVLLKRMPGIPTTSIGRILLLSWVLLGVFLFSTVTGLLSSLFSAANLNSNLTISKISDLDSSKTLAIIQGRKMPIIIQGGDKPKVVEAKTFEEELNMLKLDKIDAIIEDKPIAKYLLEALPGNQNKNYSISLLDLQNDLYVFALREKGNLYNIVNNSISLNRENGVSIYICKKYLSEELAKNCYF